jgi:hypothetical protein
MCHPKFTSFGAEIIGSNMSRKVVGENTVLFFSYDTPVAAAVNGQMYRTDRQYSSTTTKHLSKFGAKDAPKFTQAFFDMLAAGDVEGAQRYKF